MDNNLLLSEIDNDPVVIHNERMIKHCNAALVKLGEYPVELAPPYLRNAIAYWKNAKGAFKWSTGLRKQILRGEKHGRRIMVNESDKGL